MRTGKLIRPGLLRPGKPEIVRPSMQQVIEANGGRLPRIAGGAIPGLAGVFTFPLAKYKAAKTALFLQSDTNTGFTITELSVSSTGTSGFLLIELLAATNAGAGSATEITPQKVRGREGEAIRAKGFGTFTAEPTVYATNPIRVWQIPLPTAPFILQYPLGRETGTVTTTAANSGSRIGLRLEASVEVEVRGYVEIEE